MNELFLKLVVSLLLTLVTEFPVAFLFQAKGKDLLLVFLVNILITFLISSSLPITGSSLFSFALSTRSVPYFLRASIVSSALSDVFGVIFIFFTSSVYLL